MKTILSDQNQTTIEALQQKKKSKSREIKFASHDIN